MLKVKFFAILVFAAFALGAFFVSGDKTSAQTRQNVRPKADILEKVAAYKTWKQINKTDEKSQIDTLAISNSSISG